MKTICLSQTTICVLLFAAALSAADLQFDGETYVKKDAADSPDIRRVEYVRADETLDNWTKLLAIRNFTKLDDPKQTITAFAEELKKQDPPVEATTLASNDGSEAVIYFVTGAKDGSVAEFNVWRYKKVKGYPGLIAYQFACRMVTDEQIDAFKKHVMGWIKELGETDYEPDFGK